MCVSVYVCVSVSVCKCIRLCICVCVYGEMHCYDHACIVVLKGIIGYSDYSFEIVIFESFETNQIFVSF